METNPWADQWDNKNNSPDQNTETKKSQGGARATYSTKIRNGWDKTKEVASNHMKKIVVQEATDASLRWVKDKYHKTTKKQKKESHDS